MRAAKREREKGEKELQLKREALEIEKLKMQEEQGRSELDSEYRATINQLKDREIDIESTVSAKVQKMPFLDKVKDEIISTDDLSVMLKRRSGQWKLGQSI